MQKMDQYVQKTHLTLQKQPASIKNLENQMGQLATLMQERTTGALPSNIITNLKEHVKVTELKSVGRHLSNPKCRRLNHPIPIYFVLLQ